MTDLTDWLAEQHAADERAAREATAGPWRWRWASDEEHGPRLETESGHYWWDSFDGEHVWSPDRTVIQSGGYEHHWTHVAREDADHIARHNPQATLARIEAERMLVALHRKASHGDGFVCDTCAVDIDWGGDRDGEWPCPTLRALAWGYRHRDGWQAQWAPEGVEVGA